VGPAAAQDPRFLDRLAELLEHDNDDVRQAAAKAVQAVGPAAAQHPRFLDRLADLLEDDNYHVGQAAVEAVQGVGPAAAQDPRILDRLAELLEHDNENLRQAAADSLTIFATEGLRLFQASGKQRPRIVASLVHDLSRLSDG
jgi:HEAT repeat protein